MSALAFPIHEMLGLLESAALVVERVSRPTHALTPRVRVLDEPGASTLIKTLKNDMQPGPHLVLSLRFEYSEEMIYLDQYLVIEADGALSVYRNWFQDDDRQGIVEEVQAAGLTVQSVWGDLTGAT